MNCKDLHKRIIFYLEGELSEKEMEETKLHLAECNECAAFADEVEKTLAVLTAEKSPAVNPFFYTRLKAKIENRASAQYELQQKSILVKILQPAFFSILLLAGIYTGIKIGQPSAVNSDSNIYAEQEIIPYLNEMETESIENFLME
jgi:anti-sigma factor RsiW